MSSNKTPLVSIVIPAYNAARTIDDVLRHLLSQPYENIEIIVVNDGSTDDTAEILKEFSRKSRVRVITQDNAGASAARNTGLAEAKGKFTMFIDSDDSFSDDFIVKMVDAIENNPAEIVVCGHGGDGVRSILPKKAGLVEKDLPSHITSSVLRNGLLYALWNKIYYTKIIQENNIQFLNGVGFGEDLIFNLEYFKHTKKIFYIREPLYKYVWRVSGLSANTASSVSCRYHMLKALKDYLGDNYKRPLILTKYFLIKLRWLLATRRAALKRRFRK